jgi:hypothetical protein
MANWIGHILRRNCILKHVIEGKTEGRLEVTGRQRRVRKQLLDDLKETANHTGVQCEDKLLNKVIKMVQPPCTSWIHRASYKYNPLCWHSIVAKLGL